MPIKKPLYSTNIHFLRTRLGLTRKQAASMAGIKERTWSSYEEGRAFPHHLKLLRVCRVLSYTDVISLIEEDLTERKVLISVDSYTAIESLKTLNQFIENKRSEV